MRRASSALNPATALRLLAPVLAFFVGQLADLRHFLLFLLDRPVPLLQRLRVALDALFALRQAAFGSLQVLSPLAVLPFHFFAQAMRLVLSLQQRLFAARLQAGRLVLQFLFQVRERGAVPPPARIQPKCPEEGADYDNKQPSDRSG